MLPVPHTDADIVIAAGDICLQDKGVEWLRRFNKPVIYVCGNHEYWGGDFYETRELIRDACVGSQVYFLERDTVEIDDLVIHGCTLWTDYAGGNERVMADMHRLINDFRYIQSEGQPLTTAQVLTDHLASLNWLQRQLEANRGKKQIVVTHHAPSLKSWGRSPLDIIKFGYCNQFDNWLDDSGIALWVHGHIHYPADYQLGGTRVVCNPRGYHGLSEVETFDPAYTLSIS